MVENTGDPVGQLITAHAADKLRGYQGNLAFAARVIQNGWLPDENDPEIHPHLETLKQYLATVGRPEIDPFLLRLGLTVPGVQRGIVPPLLVLNSNRGGFSSKRQREAEGQVLRLRDALAMWQILIGDISSDAQQSLAELTNQCQEGVAPNDADWLQKYSNLTSLQAEQLAERALDYLNCVEKTVKEIGTRILQRLACFRERPLSEKCCNALIERRVFWPASLYRESGDVVSKRLISIIEMTAETLLLNHLLLALAWTRSTVSHYAFREWEAHPRKWSRNLHVAPKQYLHHAGWCLTDNGERHDLISKNCFRLTYVKEVAGPAVACRIPIDEKCPSCAGPLSYLFDFTHLAAEYFSVEFSEAPRKVLCCLHCSCYSPVFTSYLGNSAGKWLPENKVCDFPYDGDRDSWVRMLEDVYCPPFACAEAFCLNDATTLGGIPMWLQDAEFPRCIGCKLVMTFLAQHDNGPLHEEGIYYAFFCAKCHIAAVTYQQT